MHFSILDLVLVKCCKLDEVQLENIFKCVELLRSISHEYIGAQMKKAKQPTYIIVEASIVGASKVLRVEKYI